MRKIIAVFDGLKFSAATASYAIAIAKQSGADLIGISLEDFTYRSFKFYDIVDEGKGVSDAKMKSLTEKDKKTRKMSVIKFGAACEDAGINYSIHHDTSVAIQELLHESIYADMIIIESAETLTKYAEDLPTRFIRDLLTDVECPVLLVPNEYKPIQKISLLYDGEPTSVYAIKMLSYILESFKNLPIEVITVKNPKQILNVPDNRIMREFMKSHFSEVVYTVLKGLPEEEITKHLKKNKLNSLVVLGAYRRSRVSRWFKESMADVLMKQLKLPLFVAHNKA
ncbi:MAG TPA: universal stress protein [Chitinophagaceae bacterium]